MNWWTFPFFRSESLSYMVLNPTRIRLVATPHECERSDSCRRAPNAVVITSLVQQHRSGGEIRLKKCCVYVSYSNVRFVRFNNTSCVHAWPFRGQTQSDTGQLKLWTWTVKIDKSDLSQKTKQIWTEACNVKALSLFFFSWFISPKTLPFSKQDMMMRRWGLYKHDCKKESIKQMAEGG